MSCQIARVYASELRISYCIFRIAYCIFRIAYCIFRIAYCVVTTRRLREGHALVVHGYGPPCIVTTNFRLSEKLCGCGLIGWLDSWLDGCLVGWSLRNALA